MFTVKRVRVALGDDGRVLALLGVEVRTGKKATAVLWREEITEEAKRAGAWLFPRDFLLD